MKMSEDKCEIPRPITNVDSISAKVNAIRIAKEKEQRNASKEVKRNGDARSVTEKRSASVGVTSSPSTTTADETVEKAESAISQDSENSIPIQEKSLLQKIVRTKLVNNKYDLEIKRKDPNSPLYSVKSFEALRLKPQLLKGVYAMGFNAPSKIQETAVPTLLADPPQNMIAQSQSGTGKTAAFVLAMLSRVNPSLNYTQALCLSPTYELAVQTGEIVAKMASHCPEITIKFALRGEENAKGTEHIIIGTPGKVVDWSLKYKFFDLRKLTVFVLDEADVMIATQGHQEQSLRIRKLLSSKCQMMLFSATYDHEVMEFAEMMVPNAVVIKLKREEESLDNIKQYYVKCRDLDEKYQAMTNIYGSCTVGQMIIFCQTKRTATWLCEKLSEDGHAVAVLIGDLTVEQRISILDRFRDGKHRVLITTNVLARGIDIEQVTMVINFDLPVDRYGNPDCETYLHRIGRTGRFGKSGIAINLIDSQANYEILQEIEKHFGITIEHLDTESDDLDKLDQ